MKGVRPAFYAIIAVALIVSVCGCTDQRVGNTTIQATIAPSEVPTASVASGAHGAATSAHTFTHADDGSSEHGHADAVRPAHRRNELPVHPRNACEHISRGGDEGH